MAFNSKVPVSKYHSFSNTNPCANLIKDDTCLHKIAVRKKRKHQ